MYALQIGRALIAITIQCIVWEIFNICGEARYCLVLSIERP